MTFRRKMRALCLGTLLSVVATTAVLGYFTEAGTGAGAASVGDLPDPSPASLTTESEVTPPVAHVNWAEASSPSGVVTDVSYTLDRRIDAELTWSPAGGTCSGSLPGTTTSCDDFPPSTGNYRYRVTAHFRSWTSTSFSNSAPIAVDTNPPSSTITFPSSGTSYNSSTFDAGCVTPTGDVCGTAADADPNASGLERIEVSLQRASDGLHWDGVTWVPTVTWNVATGTANWTYPLTTTTLSSGGSYTARSRAIDHAGNTQTTPSSRTFVFDSTSPMVSSINRNGADPTRNSTVSWTVTFNKSVSGVNIADFSLVNGGLTPAPAITSLSGSGSTRLVSASTGTGSGTLRLDLVDDDSIVDTAGNPLGGPGAGNGNFTGQMYTIDRTAPAVALTTVNGSAVTFPYTTAASVTSIGGACGVASGDSATVNWSVTGAATRSGSTPCSAGSWSATIDPELSSSGSYSVLATQSDTAGNVGSSGNRSITIDKVAPTAQNIQARNNTGTAGRIDSGDIVTFTFSEAMDPNSIRTGWTGTTQSVAVVLTNAGTNDTLSVTGANLGSVALGGNYVNSNQTLNANMLMSGSTITLTLTSGSPSGQVNVVSSGTMVWSPSTSAKDRVGNSMSAASVTQSAAPRQSF